MGVRRPSLPSLSVRPSTILGSRTAAKFQPYRAFSTSRTHRNSGSFNRSDFGSQPFTGIYDPSAPTAGPLGGTSNVGSPTITPRMLKEHLDQFVVGQDRAKKVLSTAVYNHYQRIRELQRQDEEEDLKAQQRARRSMGSTTVRHNGKENATSRHPVEGIRSISFPPPLGCWRYSKLYKQNGVNTVAAVSRLQAL